MPKAGDLDWSDLYKSEEEEYTHEPTALWAADTYGGGKHGVDPLNNAKPILKKGEVPRRPSNDEIAEYILRGMDSESLGGWKDENHLNRELVTQEEADKRLAKWDNIFNDHFDQLNKTIEDQNSQDNLNWGNGKSFNEMLSEEERLKRNMHCDKDSL